MCLIHVCSSDKGRASTSCLQRARVPLRVAWGMSAGRRDSSHSRPYLRGVLIHCMWGFRIFIVGWTPSRPIRTHFSNLFGSSVQPQSAVAMGMCSCTLRATTATYFMPTAQIGCTTATALDANPISTLAEKKNVRNDEARQERMVE